MGIPFNLIHIHTQAEEGNLSSPVAQEMGDSRNHCPIDHQLIESKSVGNSEAQVAPLSDACAVDAELSDAWKRQSLGDSIEVVHKMSA